MRRTAHGVTALHQLEKHSSHLEYMSKDDVN